MHSLKHVLSALVGTAILYTKHMIGCKIHVRKASFGINKPVFFSSAQIYTSPVVTSFMQQGLLKMPSAGPATKYDGSMEWMGNRTTSLPRTAAGTVAMFQHDGSLGRKYRPKTAPNKPWACDFPGCNLRFYEKRTMTRHKRYKHAVGDRSFGGVSNSVQHEAVGTNASGS